MAKAKSRAPAKKPPSKKPAPRANAPKARAHKLSLRPAKVELTIDQGLKSRWEKALGVVSSAKRQGASAFDALWEMVAEILEHEPPLYLAGGFASARAFLQKHLEANERTAWRNIRVAKYASPDEEARYGVSKLDAVIGYVEAQAGGAVKGRLPVDFAKVRIPVEDGGKPAKRPLEDVTVDQIEGATRALLRGKEKHPSTAPEAHAVALALAVGPLQKVTVRFARGAFWFGAVPANQLAAFGKKIAAVKLPATTARTAAAEVAPVRP